MKDNLSYNKLSFFYYFVLIATFLCCEKTEISEPVIIKKPSTEYLKFNISSANDITATMKSNYHYELITTGTDPYIATTSLLKTLHQDSVVLTFEYKSSGNVDLMQIFLGPPISEERSLKAGNLSASSNWSICSINLYILIGELSWGKVGDNLRIDFGILSGIKIEIRNIHFRGMNSNEKAILQAELDQLRKDNEIASSIEKYLNTNFTSKINEVIVDLSTISINGQYTGDGNFSLCEVFPEDTLTLKKAFENKIPLAQSPFTISTNRYIIRNGIKYDRLLSKWIITKNTANDTEIVSHARYTDVIYSKQDMNPGILQSKKGLGGFFMNNFSGDLDLLNITSITVNIPITAFMHSKTSANTVPHTYGNKIYYFSQSYLNGLDNTLKLAASKNIVVAAIILVQKASESIDFEIGKILQHPSYTSEGIYTMPNLTTEEGVNCYAAALDFLASRYNRPDNSNGRIHKWIMHNEVDAGLTWTNMGNKPMLVYLDTYIKSMRICYNITRQYDKHSEVMGSFTHSWSSPVELFSSKEMLNYLQKYSLTEGDFQWGIAFHSYPQDLFEPKTWNDNKAIFSINSPLVTFKNLEVIDFWIKQPKNKFKNLNKRSLWLSENGTNSRTYGDKDLLEQAAGFAYAWKKLSNLEGIDAIQWHNWIDNRHEFGLRIGLRKFPDDETDPGGTKPVWKAYQAAGTENEDRVFEPYKSIIGINDWNEIMNNTSLQ